jgi:hypothetical protein
MPYFVYAIHDAFPAPRLEPLGEHATFAPASLQAKSLRAALSPQARTRIKVMFAETALAAEDLLLQVRERSGAGDQDA